ncbi:phage minor head protein, partial [Helicobacter sp. 12S02634-8]|uniref:phage head morphogenesis protein n=1 Tax=Helicobacter sp. 12S02634-8 TaxID=1476199 RepID=UPI0015577E91
MLKARKGEIKHIIIGASRLKTIFETNMASAYAKGKKQAQFDPDNGAVYLRYVSLMYGNRREKHKAMHGIIKHRDDPFWKENYPPNGYNCQCRVYAYTKEQLDQRGWSEHKGELPNIADKSFQGDILENSDQALDKIYLEKARRIIGVNEPSKLLKSLIFSDYQSIVENRKRWRE